MDSKFKPIKFPEDESAHNNITEWWYFNGHLRDASGSEYSFMNCLFKVDVKRVKIPFLKKMPMVISYFSHSLVSDLASKSFSHRIAPLALISGDSFSKPRLYINYLNPAINKNYVNCAIEKTGRSAYYMKNEDLELKMVSTKKPLLVGGNGFLDLHSKTTYYYSLTHLKTEGRIKINNKWLAVTGKSWMDHQWAEVSYSKDRWDWFSVQLDNDIEIVFCVYDDGAVKTRFAGISFPDGSQEHFSRIEVIPLEKKWKSPKSEAVYPLSWRIILPEKKIDLTLTARIDNQEMLFGSINYWEGPLLVEGSFGNNKVSGVGFMELVGYPSLYNNVKYIKEEMGKGVNWFILVAKNMASELTADIHQRIKKATGLQGRDEEFDKSDKFVR